MIKIRTEFGIGGQYKRGVMKVVLFSVVFNMMETSASIALIAMRLIAMRLIAMLPIAFQVGARAAWTDTIII